MDYFNAAHRATYYSTPEAHSSSSSSPDNINDSRRFGSLNSGISPPDQTWDPVDLAAFDAMTDFNDVDFRQDSEESEQTIVPPSKTRRRAQNRASQRAFRERKEKHVKGLETQLELLHEKHQDLLCSYTKQGESVVKLNGKIAKLSGDLGALKGSQSEIGGGVGGINVASRMRNQHNARANVLPTSRHPGVISEEFDAFSFTNQPSAAQSELYDGYELGLDGSIVDTTDAATSHAHSSGTATSSRLLPDFEDLLHMP